MALTDKLTAIGDAIREKTGSAELIPLSDMPSKIDAVYRKGAESEYDSFWDSFQQNGTRTSYQSAFFGAATGVCGWTDITFQPKYDMVIGGDSLYSCDSMFQYSKVVDLKGILERNGVRLDFSKAQRLHATFDRASIENFPEIDLSSCTRMQLTFQNSRMEDLTLLNIPEACMFDRAFSGCNRLENLTLSGTIGQNGFNVSSSTFLSKASIASIMGALSATTSGLTVTLRRTAVNTAFETSEGANDGTTSAEWLSLVATKQNWTISLV